MDHLFSIFQNGTHWFSFILASIWYVPKWNTCSHILFVSIRHKYNIYTQIFQKWKHFIYIHRACTYIVLSRVFRLVQYMHKLSNMQIIHIPLRKSNRCIFCNSSVVAKTATTHLVLIGYMHESQASSYTYHKQDQDQPKLCILIVCVRRDIHGLCDAHFSIFTLYSFAWHLPWS